MKNRLENEQILEILQHGDDSAIQELIQHVHPADILEAVSQCEEDISRYLERLPSHLIADVLEEADEEEQHHILKQFPKQEQSSILNLMSSDEVVDFIDDLEDQSEKNAVIGLLDQEARLDVEKLLQYAPDTAGGIMTTEFLSIYEDKTIEGVLNYIRSEPEVETPYYIYVVDRQAYLKGVVSLRDIVSSQPDVKITDIMNPKIISVHYAQDQEVVAQEFNKYGFMLMPVTDDDNHLIGIITVDDILDVMVEETTEDIHHLAGVTKEEKVDGTIAESIRSRLPWLCVNLITAILASSVIDLFSDTISKIVALSAVMTIISGMGGNAGTQTLTIVVRGLSLHEVDKKNALRILVKEIAVGLFTGVVIGVFVAIIAMFYEFNIIFGVIAAVAMILNMLCAALAGYAIPLILDKFHIDPALASGVFVTTVTDVMGFFIFLGLASLVMPYL